MLGEDYDLVSFDVFSLFTSIPVVLAIQVATVWLSNDDTLQLEPPSLLMSLLTFCISACLSTTNFTEAIKHLLVPNLRSRHGLPSVSFHGQSGHGRSEAKSVIHLPRPTELLEKKMSTLCVPL